MAKFIHQKSGSCGELTQSTGIPFIHTDKLTLFLRVSRAIVRKYMLDQSHQVDDDGHP